MGGGAGLIPTLNFSIFQFVSLFLSRFRYLKSVRFRSFSGPYFPVFGLNTERYGVSLRIQSECGKMRTRVTPNTDTFHAVYVKRKTAGYVPYKLIEKTK